MRLAIRNYTIIAIVRRIFCKSIYLRRARIVVFWRCLLVSLHGIWQTPAATITTRIALVACLFAGAFWLLLLLYQCCCCCCCSTYQCCRCPFSGNHIEISWAHKTTNRSSKMLMVARDKMNKIENKKSCTKVTQKIQHEKALRAVSQQEHWVR